MPDCGSTAITPYDSPELAGEVGAVAVAAWRSADAVGRELLLHDGTYRCASCGRTELRFEPGELLWD